MEDKERRSSKRLKTSFSIFYRIYRKTEIVGDISKIKDISEGGLCIITNQRLIEGDILELNFRIPLALDRKIKLFGRVLESRQRQDSLECETRVCFIDIDKQTRDFIQSLIVTRETD